MDEMVELKCANPYCGKTFYKPKRGNHYNKGNFFCSTECVSEFQHLKYASDPPSIFTPVGEIEEEFDKLMKSVCRKMSSMIDTNGNFRKGADEYEWELLNAIHNTLCDMVSALLARRGLTLGSSYDERTTHAVSNVTLTSKRKPRVRGKERRTVSYRER